MELHHLAGVFAVMRCPNRGVGVGERPSGHAAARARSRPGDRPHPGPTGGDGRGRGNRRRARPAADGLLALPVVREPGARPYRGRAGGARGGARPDRVPLSIAIRAGLLGRVPSFVEDLLGPLVGGPPLQVAALVGMMVVGAPVSEELLFRGYLWAAFARSARSTWVPAVVTSALFLAFHADPLQMLANVPTVAVAALVRVRTGSIWPCIAAHVGHNALAVAVGWVLPEPPAPILAGALSAALTVAGAALVWRLTAEWLAHRDSGTTARTSRRTALTAPRRNPTLRSSR